MLSSNINEIVLTKNGLNRTLRQNINNPLYIKGWKLIQKLANEFTSDTFSVVTSNNPQFWVSISDYEKYRGCKINEISEFEDHFIFGDFTPSRSCLLSFVADLSNRFKEAQSKGLLYFSIGNFVRNETEIKPGIREFMFPQLEVEILTSNQDEAKCLKLLYKIQLRLFNLMGFSNMPQVRQNNQNTFNQIIKDLDYLVQRKIRSLMDRVETARVEGDVKVAKETSNKILELIPPTLCPIFQQWFCSNPQKISTNPLVFQSDTLVGGPLTYEETVFETDYVTLTNTKFVEVAGGGNFTPLAKRFGLPDDWLAIGFAVGLLRLETALKLESDSYVETG